MVWGRQMEGLTAVMCLPGLASPLFLGLIGTDACSTDSLSFPFLRIGLREGGFVREGNAA